MNQPIDPAAGPDGTPDPETVPTARDDEAGVEAVLDLDDLLFRRSTVAADAATIEAASSRVSADDLRLLLAIRALAAERRAVALPSASRPQAIGRFAITDELGRGGFAIVYAATDTVSGHRVALKVLRPEAADSQAKRRRFRREAGLCARLVHPVIVRLLEVGEAEGAPYLVTELCPGGTLAAWLEKHPGALPIDSAARVVARLARGVDHAHACNIVHRDIKPANVLLVAPGDGPPSLADPAGTGGGYDVQLGDFGLGRIVCPTTAEDDALMSDGTRPGTVLGSPEWMAPEQVDSAFGPVGPATDVHALGLVLDRLLTGRSRHAGERPSEAFRRLRDRVVAPPFEGGPEIPSGLASIVRWCLEREPDRRPSAAALASELDLFAGTG
ncbi:MAG: serine/threonine protein kinase [Planctomycetes bacterium]|nr:serine/threonine protein kinase [Planctomycetota bacterium]MBM4012610.1 serine/threonine protein kinase [Planctomycetota bacterium]